jgi:hypothetical protein
MSTYPEKLMVTVPQEHSEEHGTRVCANDTHEALGYCELRVRIALNPSLPLSNITYIHRGTAAPLLKTGFEATYRRSQIQSEMSMMCMTSCLRADYAQLVLGIN